MKKTIIASALLTLISVAHAETETTTQTISTPVVTTTPVVPTTTPVVTTSPTTTNSATSVTTTETTAPVTTAVEPVINCQYRIPPTTTTIEQSIVTTWAQKAAVQAFNFDPASFESQLAQLKFCFTDQGWEGFNDALTKSGNINAIKSQNLSVSSQVDGDVKIIPIKDNQWKFTVPMQVVYQNDKEKLTQLLSVDLLVGRKTSGDLGIMQIIATPRNPTHAASVGTVPAVSQPVVINPAAATMPATTTSTTTTVTTPATTTVPSETPAPAGQ